MEPSAAFMATRLWLISEANSCQTGPRSHVSCVTGRVRWIAHGNRDIASCPSRTVEIESQTHVEIQWTTDGSINDGANNQRADDRQAKNLTSRTWLRQLKDLKGAKDLKRLWLSFSYFENNFKYVPSASATGTLFTVWGRVAWRCFLEEMYAHDVSLRSNSSPITLCTKEQR